MRNEIQLVAKLATPRLKYICDFVFTDYLGLSYSIINEQTNYDVPTIIYGDCKTDVTALYIPQAGLLFEQGITENKPICTSYSGMEMLYAEPSTEKNKLDFDLFSAIFFLISRYEEYQPYQPDMYGRYAHQNSLVWQDNFLHKPLVNIWLIHFTKTLARIFPNLSFKKHGFSYVPTYDIDIAYSYKGKGFVRSLGGFIQSPGVSRVKVNLGLQKDPYDAYEYLHQLHQEYGLKPIYFFLLAQRTGKYDKNLPPLGDSMQNLLQEHTAAYELGIHPSWESYDQPAELAHELETMEQITGSKVLNSRQHYIRFTLPQTFQLLLKAGIQNEYSMGYGSINGFRASVAHAYKWYDLQNEVATELMIHPFCYMDANSFFEQKHSVDKAFEEFTSYYNTCQKVQGTLISIFHNNFLGTDTMFAGYREAYSDFMRQHFS